MLIKMLNGIRVMNLCWPWTNMNVVFEFLISHELVSYGLDPLVCNFQHIYQIAQAWLFSQSLSLHLLASNGKQKANIFMYCNCSEL